ncbi:subtilisin-like protease SBT1.7 [Cryptomeria japonica]|uniref:subtilisin-like protease SBT1.7 n=1 Tax=Cryptomeria japonica TaxID=3369 RepID=UPI0027DA79B4|nr:subtilisin-like protease SBT1.7 [Cryptomeria japonica]
MILDEVEAEDSRKPYIVQMMKTMKPHHFNLDENWYTSMLSQISRSDTAIDMLYTYDTVLHGFAARMSKAEAEAMQSMDGCLGVIPSSLNQIATTHTPEFLGLISSSSLSDSGVITGEDVIIGVIDTGIWPESRSFHDEGFGDIPSRWKGECENGRGFNASHCNKKIIGARYFYKGYETKHPIDETLEYKSPRDNDGHGTHTASTIAGAAVPEISFFGFAKGTARGMAPGARLAIYKACWKKGCDSSDIAAAMEKAIADGVDIISVSISSQDQPFHMHVRAIAEFGAMEKGVFVAAAAGNAGPLSSSLSNPAPWITTVGASTIDRDFSASLVLGNQDIHRGTSTYKGNGTIQERPLPLVYSSTNNSSRRCLDGGLDPNMVKGKIVLCDQGESTIYEKSNVVARAGGAGLIVANGVLYGEEQLLTNIDGVPAINLGFRAGEKIKVYINSTGIDATATLRLSGLTEVGNTVAAPIVESFSSRGPTLAYPDILKPDIIAPGVNILAAYAEVGGALPYNILSGTSMACPHVSGIAALIKAIRPTWSPAAIKSALMTSASIVDNTVQDIRDSSTMEAADSFAIGAGHVHPIRAVDPGLVYDLGPQDYVNFLCTLKYSPQEIALLTKKTVSCPRTSLEAGDLNYPSFSVLFYYGNKFSQVKRRIVTNVGGQANAVYQASVKSPTGVKITVQPETLEFKKLEDKAEYSVRFETNITSPLASSCPAMATCKLMYLDIIVLFVALPTYIALQPLKLLYFCIPINN